MEEINKFLTEAMDECWHGFLQVTGDSIHIPIKLSCGSCGKTVAEEPFFYKINNDFSTPEGFFKLWNFAIEQDWWEDFLEKGKYGDPMFDCRISSEIINPERFAKAAYEYLNDGGSPSRL